MSGVHAIGAPTPRATLGATELEQRTGGEPTLASEEPWVTIVWNDPVNLMSYVTYVFQTYFGYERAEAERLMLRVHHEGRAVVSTGPRERMETDVAAMHSYGLWATFSRSGSEG